MKIAFDIPEGEMISDAKKTMVRCLTDEIIRDYRKNFHRKELEDIIREVAKDTVREIIEKDIDDLSDKATKAAAKTIERRAIVKLVEEIVHKASEEQS